MRKYIVEALAMFFITLAVTFTSFTGNPIPIGFMFMAMVYIGLHISGAHYNPAVSLAIFLQHKISLHDLIYYIIAQTVGALVALGLFTMITDIVFSPEVSYDLPLSVAVSMEALLTVALVLTVLSVVLSNHYKGHAIAGLVIGFALIAILSFNGIFNPAIAAAAILFNLIKAGSFVGLYPLAIHVAGPLLGAFISSYVYTFINSND